MVKGNNNLKNKSHQSSKPYDVSNSFVRKITSRVSELLPHSTWLNRWLSPAEVPVTSNILNSRQHLPSFVTSHKDVSHASTSRSDLNAVEDSVDHYIPTKRPRLPFKSQFQPSSFLSSNSLDSRKEEISPIAARGELLYVSPTEQGSSDFASSTPAGEGSATLCDKLNGDDCSETSESTSGCSSLVPQAQSAAVSRKVNSKDNNISSLTQSIVSARRTTKVDLSVLQRRRPVFNTTTFASPGRSMVRDRTNSSPFYLGRTMYGGAASNCALNTSISSRHVGPKVQPVNSCSQNLPLSSTAKRILDALEQFSTPVLDAKLSIGTKRKLESNTQRYAELSIPTTPDLLRVKRRERLLNSTRAARQTSVTASAVHHYNASSEDIHNQYKLRKDNGESDQKYAGKVRVRGRGVPVEEQPEELRLPQIKLSLNSLPAIDISVPPPPPTPPPPPLAAVTSKQSFVFAAPITVKSQTNISDVTSTFDFQFSSPLCVTSSERSDNGFSSKKMFNLNLAPTQTFNEEINHTSKTITKESENIINDNKVAVQLNSANTENTLDIKEKPVEVIPKENSVNTAGTSQNVCTECSIPCILPNTVCDVCKKELVKKNSHSSEIISSKSGTGSADPWKCKQCHVQTVVQKDTTCSTCQTSNKSFQSGFGDKFKPPSGSWKCQTCCIYNDKDVFECIACGTKKLSEKKDEKSDNKDLTSNTGFGSMFKKPAGSWSCKECWLQNSSTSLKCAACETPKPGTSENENKQQTLTKGSFGSTSDNTGFVFGIDKAGISAKLTGTDTIAKSQNTNSNNITANKTESVVNDTVIGSSSLQFGMPKAASGTGELNYTFGIPCRNTQQPSTQEKKESGNLTELPKPTVDTEGKNKLEDSEQNVSENSSQIELKKTETSQNSNVSVLGSVFNPPVYKSQDTVSSKSGVGSKLPVSSSAGLTFGSVKPPNNVESQNNNSSATNSTKFVFGSTVSVPSSFQNTTVESSTTKNVFSSGETSAGIFKFEPTKNVCCTGSTVTTASVLTAKPNTTISINSGIKENTPHTFGAFISHEEKNNFFSSEIKPALPFGSAVSAGATTFGEICKDNTTNNLELKQQNFGTPTNKDLSTNVFGSQTTPKSNVFGQPATSATTVPTFNLFGSTNTFQNTNSFPNIDSAQENKSTPVFTFGSTSNKEEAPTPGGFVFNSVVEKPQAFGFTAPGNTNNSGFAFSTATPSSTFSFTPKTESKTSVFNTAVPTFGSTHNNSAPAFGIPQATPAFGESVATPSTVFTFGATPQPQQQPVTGVFAFPASQNTCGSAPTTGTPNFVFGSSAATNSTPTPTFDPNVKPTFNFTGGATPSFTATAPPSAISQDVAPRKFRKAVRRQTQR